MSMRSHPSSDRRETGETRGEGITIPAEGVPRPATGRRRGWAIAAGVLLIFVGMEALASPYLAAFVVTLWVGWGLVLGGAAEWVSAFGASENRVWKVLLGVLYIGAGFYMLAHPGAGLVALTFMLAWLFFTQGIISIVGSIRLRPLPGSGWWLFDGVVTLLLGFLILSRWPGNSVRIIALLVGIKLIVSGVNRLALTMSP
jgi:uncharacterized membrane protein HdeD (DUF308 family)